MQIRRGDGGPLTLPKAARRIAEAFEKRGPWPPSQPAPATARLKQGLRFVVSGDACHFFFRAQEHRYTLVQAFRLDVENALVAVR